MNKLSLLNKFLSIAVFTMLVSFSGISSAHHSAIAFDMNAPLITITGKVTQFIWRSPHTSINMEVENAEGEVEIWKFEGGGTVSLVKNGVTRDSIKPGHIVSITAAPLRDVGAGGLMKSITLEDGRLVDFSNE